MGRIVDVNLQRFIEATAAGAVNVIDTMHDNPAGDERALYAEVYPSADGATADIKVLFETSDDNSSFDKLYEGVITGGALTKNENVLEHSNITFKGFAFAPNVTKRYIRATLTSPDLNSGQMVYEVRLTKTES